MKEEEERVRDNNQERRCDYISIFLKPVVVLLSSLTSVHGDGTPSAVSRHKIRSTFSAAAGPPC